MLMSSDELRNQFMKSVPRDFLEKSLRGLFAIYPMALQDLNKRFPPAEAHDLLPHYRRAMFESEWRKIAKSSPELRASFETNKTKNAWHTRIRCGKVILTASAVESPGEIVRYADFRKTLAENQTDLFRDQNNQPDKEGHYYAILLHGPLDNDLSKPGFAEFGIPDMEFQQYLERINLFSEFPLVLETLQATASEEVVADDIWPELRSDMDAGMENQG